MSIALVCAHCEHSFYLNEKWAGKNIKCPHCEGKLEVPATDAAATGQALSDFMQWASGSNAMLTGDDSNWFLQTASGRQYGPVDRRLLDYWLKLGAVTHRCQVLREGDNQWRWASELYPQLGG